MNEHIQVSNYLKVIQCNIINNVNQEEIDNYIQAAKIDHENNAEYLKALNIIEQQYFLGSLKKSLSAEISEHKQQIKNSKLSESSKNHLTIILNDLLLIYADMLEHHAQQLELQA